MGIVVGGWRLLVAKLTKNVTFGLFLTKSNEQESRLIVERMTLTECLFSYTWSLDFSLWYFYSLGCFCMIQPHNPGHAQPDGLEDDIIANSKWIFQFFYSEVMILLQKTIILHCTSPLVPDTDSREHCTLTAVTLNPWFQWVISTGGKALCSMIRVGWRAYAALSPTRSTQYYRSLRTRVEIAFPNRRISWAEN